MVTNASDRPGTDDPSLTVRWALDLAVTVGVVTGVAAVGAGVAGPVIATVSGCGLFHGMVIAKRLLFFAGFAVLAYGAIRLRPRARSRGRFQRGGDGVNSDDSGLRRPPPDPTGGTDRPTPGEQEQAWSQGIVIALVGEAYGLDPTDRLSTGSKVIAAGFAILLLTVVMDLVGLYPARVPC